MNVSVLAHAALRLVAPRFTRMMEHAAVVSSQLDNAMQFTGYAEHERRSVFRALGYMHSWAWGARTKATDRAFTLVCAGYRAEAVISDILSGGKTVTAVRGVRVRVRGVDMPLSEDE